MKKLLLIAALIFASYGAFADDFDDVAELFRRNAAKVGWGYRVDRAKRMVFFDIKFTENVKSFTRQDLADFKREFIISFKKGAGPNGVAKIKRARLTMVLKLTMADGYSYRVKIPWYEL